MGEKEWLYATTFSFDKNDDQEFAELVFEGLDTLCTVYVVSNTLESHVNMPDLSLKNGNVALEADNQFRTWRVRIATFSFDNHVVNAEMV